MEVTTIIKKPLVTEKTTFNATANNRYAFQSRRIVQVKVKSNEL